jgi:hypothetical protein
MRPRHDLAAEDLAPVLKPLVGGEDRRGTLVPACDHLKEEHRAGAADREVAGFIDLCGAPHKSMNATPAVMWSSSQTEPAASRWTLFVTSH